MFIEEQLEFFKVSFHINSKWTAIFSFPKDIFDLSKFSWVIYCIHICLFDFKLSKFCFTSPRSDMTLRFCWTSPKNFSTVGVKQEAS